ncbi:MAG: Ldh family oxidoreductase [Candidatus Eremiobacteraeota bacterium]|nr:Ldh family oxidoreductase [Candidatus Eremiobacteraeota bacterium]
MRAFVRRALTAANVRADDAELAAEVLVTSDVRGIESHGVARLERFYVDRIRDGIIDPQARETIVRETPTSLAVDAGNALGHPVSVRTMRRTIDKACEVGCAVATVRHSNHYGIAGYYAMQALERDCIGIASTNAGRLAVPTGGRQLMLGTNPFAYAVPAENGDAFVLDMATTTVALGKLEIPQRLGRALLPGWAIDATGHPTTDPAAGIAGGLLPLGGFGTENGGHKGFGLALLADIFCAVLGGGVMAPDMPPSTHMLDPAITSHFFAAIRIDAFRDVVAFKRDVSSLLQQHRESAPAAGCGPVRVAGDPETARVAEHERDGVGLDPVVVASLERVAQKCAVAPPVRLA